MLGNIVVRGAMSNDIVKDYHRPVSRRELEMVVGVAIAKLGYEADLNWIDTSKIKDMSSLFRGPRPGCGYLDKRVYWLEDGKLNDAVIDYGKFSGDISRWNTSNVEAMDYMFAYSKFNGDISQWDVRSVKTFESMFEESKFDNDLNAWDVSGNSYNPVIDSCPGQGKRYKYMKCFNRMFKYCRISVKHIESWGSKLDEEFLNSTEMFAKGKDAPSWYGA